MWLLKYKLNLFQILSYCFGRARGVSSLGSARNLAREPHVFKSSARLGSISGSSRKLEVIFFGSKARTITRSWYYFANHNVNMILT